MQAQTRTMAAAGPRLSTATRSQTGDPARAGALRLAILGGLVALAAGAAALLTTRQLLINGALTQLETVRAAVSADVVRFTRNLGDATTQIASDPRIEAFLGDGARRTSGRRKTAVDAPAPRPPRWLAIAAQRNGWSDVLLIDDGGSRVAFASGSSPQLVQDSGLMRVVQRAESRNEPGIVTLLDAGPDPAFAGQPMLYAATSVVDGGTRLGTLVVAIGTTELEAALRASSGQTLPFGLGESGSVWLVDASSQLRASIGAPLGQEAASTVLPPALATRALDEALQGGESAGAYASTAGDVLAAFSPLEVGDARWTVGAQMPESVALAPLRRLALNVAGATLLGAILGWLLGGRLWGQFSGRLRELSTVLARAQRGDRQARLEVKQDGPVAELAGAINRLLDERAGALARAEENGQRSQRDAESLLDVVKAAAEGNLAPRAQVADGGLANVSRAMNEMLEGVGSLVGSVRDLSGRVGSSATEIRGCAEQAASTASTQARE
jgi:hypothetical protein